MQNKPATPAIEAQNAAVLSALPFGDTRDFDDADRGFIASIDPAVIATADGRVIWDADSYSLSSRATHPPR